MNFRFPLIALAFGLLGAGAARADERPSATDVEGFMPIASILAKASGTLLEADLEKKRGAWVYKIKTMGADGRVTKVWVDAKSGELSDAARNKAKSD